MMKFAVCWTVFNILLVLSKKSYSQRCYEPIDEQCFIGCYYYHGVCERCANCTRDQLVDIESYHKYECTSFPALCRRQSRPVNWSDYATDFHPINLPPLIGSFYANRSNWLLMFFQEGSHPTIGKLCLNEAQKIPFEWFTFQKARLNCTGPDGVIYSKLVAVKNHLYNTSLYFALMSSPVDNKHQSALFLFTYKEIAKVFNSKTYYDPKYSDEWREFPKERIPYGQYNIGVCSWRSVWTDQQKNFTRTHPLMYDNVTTSQVLAEGDGLFTAIESTEKKGRDEKKHKIVFIGTGDGRILKIALIDLNTDPNFLEEIYFTQDPSVGITSLEVMGSPLQLKIWTTDAEEPSYEPLQRCRDMEIQCVCEQDPYCIWNDDDGSCRSFEWNYNINAQPPITKKSCEGVVPRSALLVTNKHGRAIPSPTTTSTTTGEIETTAVKLGPPNGPGLPAETGQPVPKWPWTVPLYLVCAFALLLMLFVVIFLWHTWHSRNSPTEQNWTLDRKDWTSDWTSITFNQKLPYLKLKDATEEGTEYTGRVDKSKTVFDDLKPLTDFEVIHHSERSPFLVSTKGPSFSDWVVQVNTVEVNIAGCQAQYESHLVLKCDGGISVRDIMEESVMFSGLTPNMKYVVWLEVCKKDSEEVIAKRVTDLATKEESFCVGKVDGEPCLKWTNLSSGIERYIQSCSCGDFRNFYTDLNNLVSGYKKLPPLPQNAKFNLKVMTKIPVTDGRELEHILRSVDFDTPPLALVKLPEQSSPVLSSLPEDSSGLEMTTPQGILDIDDSSSRVHSLPVSDADSGGSNEDSSSRIRSEPMLGSDFKEVASLVSRQMSEGPNNYVIVAHHTNVFIDSQVTLNNGSSMSSGIGSFQSSQSSFVELPYKGYGLQIGEEYYRCSATLLSLTNIKTKVRRTLDIRIFLSKEDVIPCICELLNYPKDETDLHKRLTNSNQSLRPIIEREVQSEQISVVTLLYKLMEILINHSQASQMGREKTLVEKMKTLYSVISFLATMTHEDCTACKAILDSVNHLWICGGYEEDKNSMVSPVV